MGAKKLKIMDKSRQELEELEAQKNGEAESTPKEVSKQKTRSQKIKEKITMKTKHKPSFLPDRRRRNRLRRGEEIEGLEKQEGQEQEGRRKQQFIFIIFEFEQLRK